MSARHCTSRAPSGPPTFPGRRRAPTATASCLLAPSHKDFKSTDFFIFRSFKIYNSQNKQESPITIKNDTNKRAGLGIGFADLGIGDSIIWIHLWLTGNWGFGKWELLSMCAVRTVSPSPTVPCACASARLCALPPLLGFSQATAAQPLQPAGLPLRHCTSTPLPASLPRSLAPPAAALGGRRGGSELGRYSLGAGEQAAVAPQATAPSQSSSSPRRPAAATLTRSVLGAHRSRLPPPPQGPVEP